MAKTSKAAIETNEAVKTENEAVNSEAVNSEAPETSAQKLERLTNEAIAAFKAQSAFENPFTDEAKKAALVYSKLLGEMKAVELEIERTAHEAEIAEKRSERLKLVANLLVAFEIYQTDNSNVEAKAAYETAREIVENELLAKYASSKAASSKAATNSEAATNGDSDSEAAKIVELWLNSGMKLKTGDFIEMGFKRSTAWHAVNNYKIANNLK